jgi:hypothetical protein
MRTLFSTQDLRNEALRRNALFFQDSNDTIRLVYNVNGIKYTEMYFGSEQHGFWLYYN